jgi:very-short-patch-repair endonuclease
MTISEQRLWNWLRNRTFGGFKFRRQTPIGRYVVDFYCAALKLAIEVDGQQHETPWMAGYDDERTRYLESQGIEVVRIANKLLATDPQSGCTDPGARRRHSLREVLM